jgi:hypothetical protein
MLLVVEVPDELPVRRGDGLVMRTLRHEPWSAQGTVLSVQERAEYASPEACSSCRPPQSGGR